MRLRFVLVFLLIAATLHAATANSDFVGRWRFVAEKSKGGEHFPPTTTLVIKQAGARMYFEYWANDRMFQKDEYRTDGKPEKLYRNANETVVMDGRLTKNKLQLTTHHLIENEIGSQSFNEIDEWVLSGDGKTLTSRPSDGKTLYFERDDSKPKAAPPPTTSSSK